MKTFSALLMTASLALFALGCGEGDQPLGDGAAPPPAAPVGGDAMPDPYAGDAPPTDPGETPAFPAIPDAEEPAADEPFDQPFADDPIPEEPADDEPISDEAEADELSAEEASELPALDEDFEE